jgi:hypothetical protein
MGYRQPRPAEGVTTEPFSRPLLTLDRGSPASELTAFPLTRMYAPTLSDEELLSMPGRAI